MRLEKRIEALERREKDRQPSQPDSWSVESMIRRMTARDQRELIAEFTRRGAEVERIEKRQQEFLA